jgi:hypothetical protein
MVCISFVFAAAPSFAGHIVDQNNGTLHAQENFGGGNLVVSVGNFASSGTYQNVRFTVRVCTDLSQTVCDPTAEGGPLDNIPPGATDRMTVPAPPSLCYFTTIFAGGSALIFFPGYCVGT